MTFKARPKLGDTQFRQDEGTVLNLSGETRINNPAGLLISDDNGSFVPIIVTNGNENDVMTYVAGEMVLRPSSASGDTTFNSNRATTRADIPSINVGGSTVSEFLEGYFFPAQPPVSAISIGASLTDRMFGDIRVGDLSWSVTRYTSPINSISISSNAIGTYNCNVPVVNGNSQNGTSSYSISTCSLPANSGVTSTSATYMICASTCSDSSVAMTNITWRNKKFYFNNTSVITSGTASAAMNVSGGVLATSKELTITQVLNNEYFYYAYPKVLGLPSFTVNGLPNNAWGNLGLGTLFSFNYTNTTGIYTTQYYVARSDNKITGTFNIVVG